MKTNRTSFVHICIFFIAFLFLAIFLFISLFYLNLPISAKADTSNNSKEIFLVYNTEGQLIFEGNFVEIGDKIIDSNLQEYEVFEVDYKNQTATAEYNGRYIRPKVTKKSKGLNFSNRNIKKSVGLYMTHNDESYVPSDGVSSIYGEGGIHDVAKTLKEKFENLGYEVYFDETLHLPHDSNAYTRSSVTAQSLIENKLDALFDIHRDGVSRSVYVKTVDGVERCKVRIVVGQKNPNMEANLQFALYLVSVAKEYCPWLFLDIYYAKGHYNQELTSKGLLFEMGTYLAEKELAQETTTYLAQVVDKTLFSTVVEEDNSLTITDKVETSQEDSLVNNILNDLTISANSFESKYNTNVVVFAVVIILCLGGVAYGAIYYKLKLRRKNNKSPKHH